MKKYLPLLLLLLAPALHAQTVNSNNFSSGTSGSAPTAAGVFASWTGTLGSGGSADGTCGNITTSCEVGINNSAGALTIQDQSASVCGPVPPNSGGPTAKILDYATTQGGGASGQFVKLNFPATQGSTELGVVWVCSDIPDSSAAFGTTGDMFVLIAGGSQISNFNHNSVNGGFHFTLEGSGQTGITYTPGTWTQLTWQWVKSGTCVAGDKSDCVRIRLYDKNGVQISGEVSEAAGGATAFYLTLGNQNAATLPAGRHFQFMNPMQNWTNATASQFPMLENSGGPTFLSAGIISTPRAADWTQAGIPGFNNGTLPSASWTQCGATIAAGATLATVQGAITACGVNQFVLMGPGGFPFNTALLQMKSNMVLRGSGANTTFLSATASNGSCAQGTTLVCFTSDSNSTTNCCDGSGSQNINVCNWTAGYAQGSNQITLSNLSGNCPGSISTTTPTLLFLDQCDTGLTGSLASIVCAGNSTDNGNLFICGQQWHGGPAGCSSSGPDGGGSRNRRTQMEAHVVTAVNGSVYTISPPLKMPNWSAGQFPQVYIAQPIVNSGIENLAIDVSNVNGPNVGVGCVNGYHVWLSGVKVSNGNGSDTNFLQCVNSIIQNNYIFQDRHGAGTNNAGYDFIATFNMVIQNNICQNVVTCFFDDGASSGNVLVDDFAVGDNAAITGSDLIPSYTGHAYNYYNLQEGDIFSQLSCDDNHGTCDFDTKYRNFLTGWQSFPSNPKSADTSSIEDYPFSRYHNNIANVMGTPGYHNTYTSTSVNPTILKEGAPFGGVPLDPLTASTSMHWGEFNIVTAATRFCTAAGGVCTASEIPTGAALYPNTNPTVGNIGGGQAAFPPSFFHTSRPAYWSASIPFPAIGPDVTNGNVGQCAGALNVVGKVNGVPATNASQCAGSALNAAWAGHVNANPAMSCYLTVMGGPPDGSGGLLNFDANVCYAGGSGIPAATLNPSGLNFGNISPLCLPSAVCPNLTVTVTNTGTANLVFAASSAITISACSPACGSDLALNTGVQTCANNSIVAPGNSCTVVVTFDPSLQAIQESATVTLTDNAGSGTQTFPVTGIGLAPSPATSFAMLTGNTIVQGKVMLP